MSFQIALLGAPGTGAEALAEALSDHLAAHPSRVYPVPPASVARSALHDALQAGDAAQHAAALASHRNAAITLLMGLDLPCPPQEQVRQRAADAQLRAALDAAAIGYRVVYGTGAARLASALRALESVAGMPPADAPKPGRESDAPRMLAWGCEKCSDPVCEHRLFTALTGGRPPAPGRA